MRWLLIYSILFLLRGVGCLYISWSILRDYHHHQGKMLIENQKEVSGPMWLWSDFLITEIHRIWKLYCYVSHLISNSKPSCLRRALARNFATFIPCIALYIGQDTHSVTDFFLFLRKVIYWMFILDSCLHTDFSVLRVLILNHNYLIFKHI